MFDVSVGGMIALKLGARIVVGREVDEESVCATFPVSGLTDVFRERPDAKYDDELAEGADVFAASAAGGGEIVADTIWEKRRRRASKKDASSSCCCVVCEVEAVLSLASDAVADSP